MDSIRREIAVNIAPEPVPPRIRAGEAAQVFFDQDPHGTIESVAGAHRRVFCSGGVRLCQLKLTDLTAARSHPVLLDAMMRAIRQGEAHAVVDLRPSASFPHARLTIRLREGGGFRTTLKPLADRTAEKPANAGHPSRRAPVDQLADVSHEIRTPLNAVIGFADALRQESFGPLGDRREFHYARLIQESGQHVLSLVNDLLDLSKADANKLAIEEKPVDVPALIDSCAAMVRLEAEKAGLTLNVHTAPRIGTRSVDPKILRQIVLNLLSNALKFTDRGSITIRTRLLGGQLVVSVEDTGVGMSRDDVSRIGQRFYQARNKAVRGGRGSGLGLALSRSLARVHGGRLEIRSAPGKGTTATLILPLKAAKPDAGRLAASPERPRRYEPATDKLRRSA